MKATGAVIRSYFQERWGLLICSLLTVCGYFMICLVTAVSVLSHDGTSPKFLPYAWMGSMGTFMLAAGVAGHNLRQMAESSAAAMLPNYRISQLKVAGLILAVFMALPAALSCGSAAQISCMLAVYLFLGCLTLWVMLYDRNGIIPILGILSAMWLVKNFDPLILSYGNSKYHLPVTDIVLSYPVVIIAVSVAGLALFVYRYQKISFERFPDTSSSDSGSALTKEEWNRFSAGGAMRTISRLSQRGIGGSFTAFRSARLIQYGMFGPAGLVTVYSAIWFVLICLGLTYVSFHSDSKYFHTDQNYNLPNLYFWLAVIWTSDLVIHRSRLAFLYLTAPLPSRDSFVRTVILAYFLNIGKGLLYTTMIAIAVHAIFPWTSWKNFPLLCAVGIVFALTLASAALLVGEAARNSGSIILPWLMISVFIGVTLHFLAYTNFYSWTLVGVLALVCMLLIRAAFYRWSRTELDFA